MLGIAISPCGELIIKLRRNLNCRRRRGPSVSCAQWQVLLDVRVLTEKYRQTYNRVRPHSSLGYRPPAPAAVPPTDLVPMLVGVT